MRSSDIQYVTIAAAFWLILIPLKSSPILGILYGAKPLHSVWMAPVDGRRSTQRHSQPCWHPVCLIVYSQPPCWRGGQVKQIMCHPLCKKTRGKTIDALNNNMFHPIPQCHSFKWVTIHYTESAWRFVLACSFHVHQCITNYNCEGPLHLRVSDGRSV